MSCPTVCVAYIHRDEPDFIERSLTVMSEHDWVTHIVVLNTGKEKLPDRLQNDKTTFLQQDFGAGFDKQPEDGGFREIAARNYALQHATQKDCGWVLICDADEFYTPETAEHLAAAETQAKDAIWFPCYHFCQPDKYIWWPKSVRRIHGTKMHDPHLRAFRATANLRYRMNPNNQFRSKLTNRTMHCNLKPVGRAKSRLAEYGVCHVHTRHMFRPKRPLDSWLERQELRSPPQNIMPRVMLEAWNRQFL